MFPTNYTFQYNPENIHTFSYVFNTDGFIVPAIMLGIIALYASIYFFAPYIYSFFLERKKVQEKEAKHIIISNLVLMKDIQGELEKEIEQSLLNITLQGKGT
ncbi:MAG: hypothetical protein WC774_01445 [Candidatus Gracilibacteria bacterium]|jgi:D-serine dehydratase